jgi:tetratricopeptide (TPR) repeat protein
MAPGRGTRSVEERKARPKVRTVIVVGAVLCGLGAAGIWLYTRPRDRSRTDLLEAAWNEFAARRFDQARAILDRRAREAGATPLDWMLRARIADAQGRWDEAIEDLKHIDDRESVAAQAWLKTGQIEVARHRARAAEAAYLHSLRIKPDQIQTRRELAYLYAIERRRRECDAQFRALARIQPLDYALAFAWCQNYCGIWAPDEAGPVLADWVAQDPTDRLPRLALAKSFAMTNKMSEAEAALAPLGESDPDARALRAEMAIERGDIAAATAFVGDRPDDHGPLNRLRGKLALQRGDLRRAVDYFRRALTADADDRDAIHGLGMALRRLGEPEADRHLDHAARIDKLRRTIIDSVTTIHTDRKLFCTLGTMCEGLGRLEEARAWYRIAIERDPLDSEAQQGLTRTDRATAPSPH